MLAAGAIHPALTIPVAVAVVIFLAWFWRRLGRPNVPPSRRLIRRCSVSLMIVTVPILVAAMSLFDSQVDQRRWVTAWTIVTLLLLLIIASAVVDATNNLRIHRLERADAMTSAAADLVAAMRQAQEPSKADAPQRPPPPDGGTTTDTGDSQARGQAP